MSIYFSKCPHFFKGGGTLSPILKFLGRTLLLSSSTNLCIQFWPRSVLTKWPGSKLFDTLIGFLDFFFKKKSKISSRQFVCADALHPVNNFSVMPGWFPVFLGWTSTIQRIVSYSRTQGSASGKSQTSEPSIKSTSLPLSRHARH